MKNEQFTPGPWHSEGIHPDNGRIQIGSSKDWICEMYSNPDDEGSAKENEIQEKANANLIAAAPDMYEALKHIVAWLSEYGYEDDVKYGYEDGVKDGVEALLKANPNYQIP